MTFERAKIHGEGENDDVLFDLNLARAEVRLIFKRDDYSSIHKETGVKLLTRKPKTRFNIEMIAEKLKEYNAEINAGFSTAKCLDILLKFMGKTEAKKNT